MNDRGVGPELWIGLLGVDEWPAYRALRLEALTIAPQAFGASLASMSDKPDEFWRNRLTVTELGPDSILLFAKLEGELVGMVGAFINSTGVANIISMYVSPATRRRGIGKQLLQAILDVIATDESIREATLTVNGSLPDAMALYSSAGFEVVDRSCAPMGDGIEYEHVEMVKRLS